MIGLDMNNFKRWFRSWPTVNGRQKSMQWFLGKETHGNGDTMD